MIAFFHSLDPHTIGPYVGYSGFEADLLFESSEWEHWNLTSFAGDAE